MSDNIKDYRQKELVILTLCNIILMLSLTDQISLSIFQDYTKPLEFLGSTFICIAIQILIFIFDAIYTDQLKNKLIWLNSLLPGQQVFSYLITSNKDSRINAEVAHTKYKDIYDNMPDTKKKKAIYENFEWYKLFQKYEKESKILVSHRDWLLCRDINIAYLNSAFSYLLFSSLFKAIPFSWFYIMYLLLMILLTNIASRVKANSFILNVIAIDLSRTEES